MDQAYKNDVERIQRLIVSIKADLQKREQQVKAGKPVSLIDGEVRGQLTNLDRELDVLAALIKNQDSQLLAKEQERRKNQMVEFKNQKQQLKETYDRNIVVSKETNVALKTQNVKEDPRFQMMNQNDLYQNQKALQEHQDRELDKVNSQAVQLKYAGQAIGSTVDLQNRQLDKLNVEVDTTTQQMMQTNSKLAKFVASSSNTMLIIFIILEIIVFACICVWVGSW